MTALEFKLDLLAITPVPVFELSKEVWKIK